jgi:hypothetical protein
LCPLIHGNLTVSETKMDFGYFFSSNNYKVPVSQNFYPKWISYFKDKQPQEKSL